MVKNIKVYFSTKELNRIRQWFNAVQDITPVYLDRADYILQRKVLKILNWPTDKSIEDFLTKTERIAKNERGVNNGIHTGAVEGRR